MWTITKNMLAKLTSVQAFEPVNELLLQLLSEFDGELVRTEAEGASSEWKKHFTKKVKNETLPIFLVRTSGENFSPIYELQLVYDVTLSLCWRIPV